MTISSMPLTDVRREAPDSADLPRLERHGGVTRLMVDGKPYLAIGGELHNSTSSDPATFDGSASRFARPESRRSSPP